MSANLQFSRWHSCWLPRLHFVIPMRWELRKCEDLKILDLAKTRLTWIAGGVHALLSREISSPTPSHFVFSILVREGGNLTNHRINHPIHLEEGLNLMQLRLSPGSDKSHKGPWLKPLWPVWEWHQVWKCSKDSIPHWKGTHDFLCPESSRIHGWPIKEGLILSPDASIINNMDSIF